MALAATEGRLLENQFRTKPDSLFHDPDFYRLHATPSSRFFEWEVGGAVRGIIHFDQVKEEYWRSPARGTYCGYHSVKGLSLDQLVSFNEAVELRLTQLGAKSVEILPAPEAHDVPMFANTLYALLRAGYAIERCDIDHCLTTTASGLFEVMSYGNRKRLKKCEREGMTPRRLELDDLARVYETITVNRSAKGYAVSMELAELEAMAACIADRIVLFGIPDGSMLIAAAICLQVRSDILYIFYWGDRPGYSTLSPVVSLASHIYDYCLTNGLRLLDAGTSTVGADMKLGLINFKAGLGFQESLKVRLVKHWGS